MKGLAAYAEHARNLGFEKDEIHVFLQHALALCTRRDLTAEDLVALLLETGKVGVTAMALLDQANTTRYGNPEITSVNIGVGRNPAILISGHDLKDIEDLLAQTAGTGVDVYTHSEMLPAHYYPAFKKHRHLAGHYGNAWWRQREEFETFNGPVVFTINRIVPPLPTASYQDRIYTTGAAGFPGCQHISSREDGKTKNFSQALPNDTVILTAGCAKYRYNKLPLGDTGGIPRVLDAGQCNDSYSLVLIALNLQEVFGLQDINDLAIVYNIAWYEQKAVILLLDLLHLGVKNIHLGPTLPTFLSPNVAKVLVDNFGISTISTPAADIAAWVA